MSLVVSQNHLPREPKIEPFVVGNDVIALSVLAHRAARIAIAKNPNHPLAYYVLGLCFDSEAAGIPGISPQEAVLHQVTAFRRFLDRMPLPNPDMDTADGQRCVRASGTLGMFFDEKRNQNKEVVQPRRVDFWREYARLCRLYQQHLLPQIYDKGQSDQSLPEMMKSLEENLKKIDGAYTDQALQLRQIEQMPIRERVKILSNVFPGEVIKLLGASDLNKEFGAEAPEFAMLAVHLLFLSGLLEDGDILLNKVKTELGDHPGVAKIADPSGYSLEAAEFQDRFLAGDYRAYAAAVEKLRQRAIPHPPSKAEIDFLNGSSLSPATFLAFGALTGTSGYLVTDEWYRKILLENQFQREMGVAWLLDGNMALAQEHFRKAIAPFGVALATAAGQSSDVERFLKLIDDANKPEPP